MTKNEKRRIIITKEQEEKMAAASAQKIQAYANELSQVQSRRLEMTGLLLQAHVTHAGLPPTHGVGAALVDAAANMARLAVENDSKQKWADIKAMFAELGVEGPQPHLEWAARKVGVQLFEAPSLIHTPELVAIDGKDPAEVLQ